MEHQLQGSRLILDTWSMTSALSLTSKSTHKLLDRTLLVKPKIARTLRRHGRIVIPFSSQLKLLN
jgi:hypothetical protein